MNISALSNDMMINITERWLESAKFCNRLKAAGPIGVGILDELHESHVPLAELEDKRREAHEQLRALIDKSGQLDDTHDRYARSLYYHLYALIEAADTDEERVEYERLQTRLFPRGLRVVRMSYMEEGGRAASLDRGVKAKLREKLANIPVGKRTLLDLFEAWMAAGNELGQVVRQRAELEAALAQDGSASDEIDIGAARKRWMQAIKGLLWAVETRKKLYVLDEPVRASLRKGIALTRRRREDEGAGEGEGEAKAEAEEELELDEELDFDADFDSELDFDSDEGESEDDLDVDSDEGESEDEAELDAEAPEPEPQE